MIGFVFCVIASYASPNASYYLFPTRAWEMMLGGVAYLYPFTLQKHRKKLLEWCGLALISGSYFLVSADNPWPGYLALFPVLGSFLVLQAQRNDSIITNNVLFQKIGSWSYSIYLWHWPFVVAIYTFSLPEYYTYIGMTLSIIFGFLSYKYVERIRFNNNFSSLSSYIKSPPIYIAGVVALLGSALFTNSNAITDYRLSMEQSLTVKQQQHDPNDLGCRPAENEKSLGCIHGSGPVKAIIIGDSHARTQISTIRDKAALAGGSVLSLVMPACPTIKNVYRVSPVFGQSSDYSCGRLVADAVDLIPKAYPNVPVIIINRTSFYIHGFNEANRKRSSTPNRFVDKVFSERGQDYDNNMTAHMADTICDFSKNNPVYLSKPIPEMKINVPESLFRDTVFLDNHDESIKITHKEYYERHSTVLKMQSEVASTCGVKILDPIHYLCDSEYCYSNMNGKPLYFDDDHLSSYGAMLISPMYDEIFE